MDDGLVIDLSPMKGVRVDPAKQVGRVGGGATLGRAEQVLRPLRDVAEVKAEQVEVMPSPALQSAFDDVVPKGMQNYWKAGFATELTDEAIAAQANTKWVGDHYAAIHPYSGSAGGHINSGDDDHRVAANSGANYERLSAVKSAYDPDNLFHVHQNIAPAKRR